MSQVNRAHESKGRFGKDRELTSYYLFEIKFLEGGATYFAKET